MNLTYQIINHMATQGYEALFVKGGTKTLFLKRQAQELVKGKKYTHDTLLLELLKGKV